MAIQFSKETIAYLNSPAPQFTPIRPLGFKYRASYNPKYSVPFQDKDNSFVYVDPFNGYSGADTSHVSGYETVKDTPMTRGNSGKGSGGGGSYTPGKTYNSNPDVASAEKGLDNTINTLKKAGWDGVKDTGSALLYGLNFLSSALYAVGEHHMNNLKNDYMTADSAGGEKITTGEHVMSFVRDVMDPVLYFTSFGMGTDGIAERTGLKNLSSKSLMTDYSTGFKHGIDGTHGVEFIKIVKDVQFKDWSARHQIGSAALGFGLDIVMDPLTYVGIAAAPGFIAKGGHALSLGSVGKKAAAKEVLNSSIWTKAGRAEGLRVLKNDITQRQLGKLTKQEKRVTKKLDKGKISHSAYQNKVNVIATKKANTTVDSLKGFNLAVKALEKHKLTLGALAVSRMSEGAHKAGKARRAADDLAALKLDSLTPLIDHLKNDSNTKSMYYLMNDGTNSFSYKTPNGKTYTVRWDGTYDDFVEKIADHASPISSYNSARTRLARGRKSEIQANQARVNAFFDAMNLNVKQRSILAMHNAGQSKGVGVSILNLLKDFGDHPEVRSYLNVVNDLADSAKTPIFREYKVNPDGYAGTMTVDEFKNLSYEDLQKFAEDEYIHLTDINRVVDPRNLSGTYLSYSEQVLRDLGIPKKSSALTPTDRLRGLNADVASFRDEYVKISDEYLKVNRAKREAMAQLAKFGGAVPDVTYKVGDMTATINGTNTPIANNLPLSDAAVAATGTSYDQAVQDIVSGTMGAFMQGEEFNTLLKNTGTELIDGQLVTKDFHSKQTAGQDLDVASLNSRMAVAIGEMMHEAFHSVAKYNAMLEEAWQPEKLVESFSNAAAHIFNKTSVDIQEMSLSYLYATHGIAYPSGLPSGATFKIFNREPDGSIILDPTVINIPDGAEFPVRGTVVPGKTNPSQATLHRPRNNTVVETRGEPYATSKKGKYDNNDFITKVNNSMKSWLEDVFGKDTKSLMDDLEKPVVRSAPPAGVSGQRAEQAYLMYSKMLESLNDPAKLDDPLANLENTNSMFDGVGYSTLDLVMNASYIKDANRIQLNGMYGSTIGRLAVFDTYTPPASVLETAQEIHQLLGTNASRLLSEKFKDLKLDNAGLEWVQKMLRQDLIEDPRNAGLVKAIKEESPNDYFSNHLGSWARLATTPGANKKNLGRETGITPALAHSILEEAFGGPLAGKTLDNAIREFLMFQTYKKGTNGAADELVSVMDKYFSNPSRLPASNTIRNIIHRANKNPDSALTKYRNSLNWSSDLTGLSPTKFQETTTHIETPTGFTAYDKEKIQADTEGLTQFEDWDKTYDFVDPAEYDDLYYLKGDANPTIMLKNKTTEENLEVTFKYDPNTPDSLTVVTKNPDGTEVSNVVDTSGMFKTMSAKGKGGVKKTEAMTVREFNSKIYDPSNGFVSNILGKASQTVKDAKKQYLNDPTPDLSGTGTVPKYGMTTTNKTIVGRGAGSIDPALAKQHNYLKGLLDEGNTFYDDLTKEREAVQKEIEDLAKLPEGERAIADFVNYLKSQYHTAELESEILKAHDNIVSNLWALQNKVFKQMKGERIEQGAGFRAGVAPTLPVPHMLNFAHYQAGVTMLRQEQGRVSDLMTRFMSPDEEINALGVGGAYFAKTLRRPSSMLDQRIMEIRRSIYNSYEPIIKVTKDVINASWPPEARSGAAVRSFLSNAHLKGASAFPPKYEKGFNEVVARLKDLSENIFIYGGRYEGAEDAAQKIATQINVPYGVHIINGYMPKKFKMKDTDLVAVHTAVVEHNIENGTEILPFSHEWLVIAANTIPKSHPLSLRNNSVNFAHYEFALQDARLKMQAGDDFKTSFYNTFGSQLSPSLVAMQNNTTGLQGVNSKLASIDEMIRTGRLLAADVPNVFRNSGWYVPEDFVKEIKFTFDYIHNRDMAIQTRAFSGALSHISSFWKKMVTIYNPTYHTSNQMSDMFMSFMDGVRSPKVYTDGLAVVWNARGMLNKISQDPEAFQRLKEAMGERFIYDDIAKSTDTLDVHAAAVPNKIEKDKYGIFNLSTKADRITIDLQDGTRVSLDDFQLYKLFNETGLSQNFIRSSIMSGVAGGRKGMLARTAGKIDDKIVDFSDFREEASRMAHFIHAIRDEAAMGGNLTDVTRRAADRVMKYRFDYSDVSQLEQNWIGNWVPFYKWMKNIIPFTIEIALTKPRYLTMENKMNLAASEAYGTDAEEIMGEDLVYIPHTTGNGMIPWTTYLSLEDNRVMPDYAILNFPLLTNASNKIMPAIDPIYEYTQGYGDAKSMGVGVLNGMARIIGQGFAPQIKAANNAMTDTNIWASSPAKSPNTWPEELFWNTIPGGVAYRSAQNNQTGDPMLRLGEALGLIKHKAVTTKNQIGAVKQNQDKANVELDKAIQELQEKGVLSPDKTVAKNQLRSMQP